MHTYHLRAERSITLPFAACVTEIWCESFLCTNLCNKMCEPAQFTHCFFTSFRLVTRPLTRSRSTKLSVNHSDMDSNSSQYGDFHPLNSSRARSAHALSRALHGHYLATSLTSCTTQRYSRLDRPILEVLAPSRLTHSCKRNIPNLISSKINPNQT